MMIFFWSLGLYRVLYEANTLPNHTCQDEQGLSQEGGHSLAPKTASVNAANANVRNRQMIGRPIILQVRLSWVRLSLVRLGLYSGYVLWRLRQFSFGGCGLALAALALVLFGAYDSYPVRNRRQRALIGTLHPPALHTHSCYVKRNETLKFLTKLLTHCQKILLGIPVRLVG